MSYRLSVQSSLASGGSDYSRTVTSLSDYAFTLNTDMDVDDTGPDNYTWQCTKDGLLAMEYEQMPLDPGNSIDYTEVSGITIPTADRFRPGETWETHYVATYNLASGESDVETIDLTHEVIGVEAVSVPAGDFPEAVRIESTRPIASDENFSFSEKITSWYVAGVGLVRQEEEMMIGTITTELLDYE